MAFAFGSNEKEWNETQKSEKTVTCKEITVYSGEKCVLFCYGTVEPFENGSTVRITEANGNVYTVYNGVVIVKENLKNM